VGSLVVGVVCDAQQDLGNRPDAARSDAARCAIGLTECGGVCVDLLSDPKHCGTCFAACAPDQFCGPSGAFPSVVGPSMCSTACPGGGALMNCDGACVALIVNSAHCGACGNLCPVGMHCEDGYCDSCPLGTTFCRYKGAVGHSGICLLPDNNLGGTCE